MTTETTPKVEFALGSEVSPGRFFKSAFARTFTNGNAGCRDCKSLDYELLHDAAAAVAVVSEDLGNNNNNNNARFFSLAASFTDKPANGAERAASRRDLKEAAQSTSDANELEKLRKQCQLLKKENRRLQSAFLQNGFLQARVDTLQWQFKQVESNRQMYRSVMEQVAYFLDRAHKSLEILHIKDNPKDKRRVPRSRSVHAVVHADPSPSRVSTSSPSPSGSSRFTRAKSVTQMSPSVSSIRDFTWSVLRKNDPVYCTTPRAKPSQDLNKTHDDIVYQEPKQSELNPDEIPPEKLSQEAYRLLRLVDSLLATREPDLARVTPVEDNGSSPSPTERHHYHDVSVTLQSGNFVNSTTLQEAGHVGTERGNESNLVQTGDSGSSCYAKTAVEVNASLQATSLPRTRRSPDTTSWNSSSSKTTEEEDTAALAAPSSKQLEKKESTCKAKSPVSVSSAESESGFSSISSFQEVGLPSTSSIRPIKGCHTEVGLPEVPLDKTRHRRWTSTPAELQALYKLLYSQHRGSFGGSQATSESVSVCWV
ncbi:uncharacterized protein LOC116843713 isoform X2 [Odontomachus brunneus]|uniref:uncharacterized protein LOC116843713 isoform X2 n=1 Tax=Odontomachus brunneus TaxID=486640 RepID=UPI0013F2570C|nr:uncharacterized protein LOC116843713 isoform X2 [Odontomachus brunneus]